MKNTTTRHAVTGFANNELEKRFIENCCMNIEGFENWDTAPVLSELFEKIEEKLDSGEDLSIEFSRSITGTDSPLHIGFHVSEFDYTIEDV